MSFISTSERARRDPGRIRARRWGSCRLGETVAVKHHRSAPHSGVAPVDLLVLTGDLVLAESANAVVACLLQHGREHGDDPRSGEVYRGAEAGLPQLLGVTWGAGSPREWLTRGVVEHDALLPT